MVEAEKLLTRVTLLSKAQYDFSRLLCERVCGVGENWEVLDWLEQAYASQSYAHVFMKLNVN